MTVIAVKDELSLEAQKRFVAEQIWLDYFNQTLFERGIITERERNKMKVMIESRKPSSVEKKKDVRKKTRAAR